MANYPTQSYAATLTTNPVIMSKFPNSTNITLDVWRNNILGLNIYYEELSYVKLEQFKKTEFIDLIANFGGQFGLEFF
jgi:hypothetical protein